MKKNNKNKSVWDKYFLWKVSEEEIAHQVQEYDSLGIFKSARKDAAQLWLFLFIVLILSAPEFGSFEIIMLVFMLFMSACVWKGWRWAMLLTVFLFTINIVWNLFFTPWHQIKIFLLFFGYVSLFAYYKAFKVEQVRRKNRLGLKD